MPAWYAHEPCQEVLSMVVRKTCVNLPHHDEPFWHQWDSDGLYVMSTSLANHPCKHLGTGPGVVNVARHSSCHVEAFSTRIPTSRSIPLPQTRADNTTPSSSSWHPSNEKTSLRNKHLYIFEYQTDLNENTSLMQSNKYIFHLSLVSTCFGQYIAHHQEINKMYKISIWCQTVIL